MKKNFVLTLLALSMLCVLTTGCGSQKNDTAGTNNSTVQDTMDNNGSGGSGSNGGSSNGSTSGNNGGGSGSSSGSSGTSSGSSGSGASSSQNGATSGVPYDELLGDGQVTDHDGNLNNNASGSTSSARNR